MFNLRPENEDTFSVTIIDNFGQTRVENQAEVDFITLNLMLNADFVTIEGTTIKKTTTRVDDAGNVYFYGNEHEKDYI
ncbi:hypothetical protein [Lysinibacillus sp. Y5S-8]|uniref:hypothetical protein n=1 Tax=Lysinibacillus sp. Y5S-8 TaxID=3122488 RepID=UPI0030CC54B1